MRGLKLELSALSNHNDNENATNLHIECLKKQQFCTYCTCGNFLIVALGINFVHSTSISGRFGHILLVERVRIIGNGVIIIFLVVVHGFVVVIGVCVKSCGAHH